MFIDIKILRRSAKVGYTFVCFALMACQTQPSTLGDEKTIRIGLVVPLTGSEAGAGQSIQRGVELKLRELNSKGGIGGSKFELVTLDDRGKPDESALAVVNLIVQKKVQAIIGTLTSTGTLAMAPIAEKYKVPLIAPTATHPKVTETGENVFRVCFVESAQGKAMARFALDNLHLRRIAILYDSKSDYSLGLKTHFTQTLKNEGGEVIAEQSFSSGDIDFKSQLTHIRTLHPEAIFIPAYYTEVGLIARQARELGMKLPLLGGDGWDSPRLLEIAGSAMEETFFTNHYSQDDLSPEVQGFLKSFRQEFKTIPDAPAALGYDSLGVLAHGLMKSHGKVQLRAQLAAIQEFRGVTGLISIDRNRNAMKPITILRNNEGRQKFQARIDNFNRR